MAHDELTCNYCGLPVSAPRFRRTLGSRRELEGKRPSEPEPAPLPAYCCFGCRFAAKVTGARGEHGATNWTLTRLGLSVFFTMNVLVFSMALWPRDVYDASEPGAMSQAPLVPQSQPTTPSPLTNSVQELFRYLCLLMAFPVLLMLGGPLFASACASLRRGALAADLLLLLGVAASYIYSAASVWNGGGHVYFEVGCVVLVLVTFGRWLEAVGKLRTTEAIESLHKLLPDSARLVRSGSETTVPVTELVASDLIRILPGERFATDGRVYRGSAAVSEQILTGESGAVIKEPGDSVFAGTTNLDGDLVIEVCAGVREGTIARLVDLVRRACRSRGRYQRLADQITGWFIPAVTLVALVTVGVQWKKDGPEHGILSGLAVLLIACPCALGLATPMAMWTALGTAARGQLLFRDGESMERLASVKAVWFDKTGTLTTGAPAVSELVIADEVDPAEVLATATWLGSASSHSLARAISASPLWARRLVPHDQSHQVRTLAGRGVAGTLSRGGPRFYLGSVRLMDEMQLSWPGQTRPACEGADASDQVIQRRPLSPSLRDIATQSEDPITCVGWDGLVRGVFRFHEQMRPESRRAVARLLDLRLPVRILTGDHAARGEAIERELGVPVESELPPEGKVAAVERARGEFGSVAMVGDGINDAPALAASDVGIVLGCGADIARDAADVCLLSNDLTRVPWAIELARRAVLVIRQNLFWAFAYNVVGIGFACTGRLNPVLAALAMVLSSALVVTNSMRLAQTPSGAIESDSELEPGGSNMSAQGDAPEGVGMKRISRLKGAKGG